MPFLDMRLHAAYLAHALIFSHDIAESLTALAELIGGAL